MLLPFYLLSLAVSLVATDTTEQPTAYLSNGIQINGTWWQPDPALKPVRGFFGVPFASSIRFEAPKEYKWDGVKSWNASVYGPSCAQVPAPNDPIKRNYSEDCLFLDIYAPQSDHPLPVLIWIYGGYYDGTWLAQPRIGKTGVVVVSINYRLGPFGYLRTPLLGGNLGLLDQKFAMEWIEKEIVNFGGDPTAITIAGESAGAISICAHLVTSGPNPPFSQAILQSGFCYTYPAEAALANGEAFAKNVGCPDHSDPEGQLKCLQELPTDTLLKAMYTVQWGLNVDGKIILEQPSELIKQGNFVSVPMIYGNCLNENSLFLCPQYPKGITDAEYRAYVLSTIKSLYPATNATQLAELVVKKFPSSAYADPLQALIDVTDLLEWFCPMQKDMQAVATAGIPKGALVFQYAFELIPGWTNECFKVAHSFDLPFTFPLLTTAYKPGYKFTATEKQLSEFMLDSWMWFVLYGTPGDIWMPSGYPAGSWNYTVLSEKPSPGDKFRLDDCQWWWNVSDQ